MLRFLVVRFRCPKCRATATALPDDVLSGVRQDLATVAEIVATYLDGACGYRELPLKVLGVVPPEGLTVSTLWGQPEAPSPTPSTCFRWLARFAAGARAWWNVAATALQQHGEYFPPSAPAPLDRSARKPEKREALRDAWRAIDACRTLAVQRDVPIARWPFVMRHAPTPPTGLDRTGWFCKPPPPT